jgi:hypothetical protein
VGAKDTVPTFHAETHPPGTAPPHDTYEPAPEDGVPRASAASATDSLPGATSADLHAGLGHPGQGQSSAELHHGGNRGGGGQKQTAGLEGVGAGDRLPARAEETAVGRKTTGNDGSVGGGGLAAQERIPEGAESVAAEAPSGR